ncbi:MAG TPA: ABC transporter permease [Candidatus Eisenbacteria bacterium]|nr:ABC transporter permease [Candidatus Eisenbacteria bacterium]
MPWPVLEPPPDVCYLIRRAAMWYRFLNPLRPMRDLYVHRELLGQFARREIEARYRGSYLGLLWSLITPLVMLATYTLVFSTIFQARWRVDAVPQRGEFALTLFAGLIAFNLFAECVTRAPTLVVANTNYVKNVVFPIQILPVSALGAALFHGVVNVAILLVASLVVFGTLSHTLWLLPVAALPLLAFSLGLSWLLASLGVFLRDTTYAVGMATQILFFLTPVFYRADAVPEPLRTVLGLNPLSNIVEDFRRVLVWSQTPDWTAWSIAMATSAAVFVLGYAWFMITKPGFADVL